MKPYKIISAMIVCFILLSLALLSRPSFAIMDSFDTDKDGRRIYRQYKEGFSKPDTTCLSLRGNDVLHLPMAEMINSVKSKTLDEQLDILCCSAAAQMNDKGVKISEIIGTDMPNNAQQILEKLNNEHADSTVHSLLVFFAVYNFSHFNRIVTEKGRLPADNELAFDAKTARLLVKKAEGIQDEGMRDFLLDWLIPALPHKEALARQAKREKH